MVRSRVAVIYRFWLMFAHTGRSFSGDASMHWFGVLFASIGAALILGALTYVSILIGVLVNFMIILMSGPLIDKVLAKRGRRSA